MLRPLRRWWIRRTLRARITMVVAVVALLVFGWVAQVTSAIFASALTDQVDGQLRATLDTAAADITAGRPAPSGQRDQQIRVLDSAGGPIDGGDAPRLTDWQIRDLRAGKGVSVFPMYAHRGEPEQSGPAVRWVGRVVSVPDGSQRLVVVGTEFTSYLNVFERAGYWFLPGALLSMIAVAGTAWVAVRLALRPVQRMRQAAGALPPGERLPVPEARDELRALAEELNALLARRDEAAERMRRFSGDAAHELRSPVASLRVQAEVAVAHPDPDLAQETLADIAVEAERLSQLVDDLLMLARADAVDLPEAEPVDLVEVARASAARLGERGIVVRVEAPTPVLVLAAPREVQLVVDNVLRNAARYARALVRVLVLPAGTQGRLLVEDDGPGVPEEQRDQVFERFHRVDEARDRASGGAGLGLALVADLVRRRGGTVRAAGSPEGGARFEIRWPKP
ncbi:HAMP domain-containing histidine kinase [Crossiella sp. SN42]|uniref:sensor histidine kinase n=1 Tax=Crossiella sp. SN42 TaxID=2944808 RepID=UPI00207D3667|nr:HAMP domain-containing sensor histidine kinase [Crossiella sp. SN42]MCO1577003.1 HAMP domain-containing histidine kinase [Crossiella sp. SN42]